MRDAEHEVKVAHRQQFLLPCAQPLLARVGLALRTMAVAAGVIRDGLIAAANALVAMSAERCRAAAFDGGEHLHLRPAQRLAIAFDESASCPADDVGHLPGWPLHDSLDSGGSWSSCGPRIVI